MTSGAVTGKTMEKTMEEAMEGTHDLRASGTGARRPVGVVGLGLMGGSLARRLRARGRDVVAWNHRPHPYAQAREDGIRCAGSLEELVAADPEVIVLCNPLKAMPAMLDALRPLLEGRPSITLTDVGSVKGMVREQVDAAGLGGRYVGAHPMAGNELSGWTAADPSLYDDALWAVTVRTDTDYARFLAVARLIADDCANRLIVLDDATHDRAAALISHMPHVVATALVNELSRNGDRAVAAALAAGSWRDMTRVALTDPDRTRAMVEEDAANVEALLRSLSRRLESMADLLGMRASQEGTDRAGADGVDAVGEGLSAFFAEGEPFREYKRGERARAEAEASGDGAGVPPRASRELTVDPASDWRAPLLAAARAGEHVVRFVTDRTMLVETRSAL